MVATTLVDRLPRHAVIVRIEGTSYRLRRVYPIFGMKLFFRWAHLNRSPGPGWRSRATPVLARWRSRCAERGLRQAGCVAARPAAGCSRLQSFICCGPTIPQVWPGMSSAGLEARRAGTDGIHGVRLLLGIERSKGKRRNPFHGRGRAVEGRSCGFFLANGMPPVESRSECLARRQTLC